MFLSWRGNRARRVWPDLFRWPVARKIEPLNKLLTARTQLANLLSYMDGKSKAEDLLSNVLKDNSLLQALAAAPKADGQAGSEEKK